jgi:chlorobactene glucosyltransferase
VIWLVWALPFLLLVRLARQRPHLREHPPLTDGPLVSIIVPARNEEETIETVITSVLASQYRNLELLIVDDRSTDATASKVESRKTEDSRLRLIHGEELPDGWYGKPWACVQGARAARGEILLFTDADTKHEPELLGRSVSALQRTGVDLVTVSPHQACLTFWERVVMPQVWVLLGFRFHPSVVTRAKRAWDVIANGQYIMTTRAAYETVGTHAIVKAEVAEDLMLAQQYHRAGKRIWFGFADRYMTTRMYRGLAHLIEGWSKNVYLGGRASFPGQPVLQALVPFALGGAMIYWLVPPLLWATGAMGLLSPWFTQQMLWATASSAVFWTLIMIGMRIPFWLGVCYPLGALMTLYIVVRSTLRGERRVEWKGRTYDQSINQQASGGSEAP